MDLAVFITLYGLGDQTWLVSLVAEIPEGRSATSKVHHHYRWRPYQCFRSRRRAICQNNGETNRTAMQMYDLPQTTLHSETSILVLCCYHFLLLCLCIVTHTARFQYVSSPPGGRFFLVFSPLSGISGLSV